MVGSSNNVTRFLVRGVISSVPSMSLSLIRMGGRRGLGCCPWPPYDDGASEPGMPRIMGVLEEEEEEARRRRRRTSKVSKH